MVSIPVCRIGDPGSIPGGGAFFIIFLNIIINNIMETNFVKDIELICFCIHPELPNIFYLK